MADRGACLRPDMFLRIEVGTGGWKMDEVETWVGLEEIGHQVSGVPGRTVKEQEHRLSGISQQQVFKEGKGGLAGLDGGGERELVSGIKVKRTVQMNVVA